MPEVETAILSMGEFKKLIENDDGDVIGEQAEMVPATDLIPSLEAKRIMRQLQAILEPLYLATINLQGMVRGDVNWVTLYRLWLVYSNTSSILKIPNPVVATGEEHCRVRTITYIDMPIFGLHEAVQQSVSILAAELQRRIIDPGPARSAMICLYLNLSLDKSKLLSESQMNAMAISATKEMRRSASYLCKTQMPVPVVVPLVPGPVSQPMDVPPISGAVDFSDMGVFSIFVDAEEASPGAVYPPDAVASEMASFKELKLADLTIAVVDKKFDPSLFFADPSIQLRFPLHVHMAKSHYSAINHEATSERTFSDVSRQRDDLRLRNDPQNVCGEAVLLNAGEKIQKMTPVEIMPHYKSKRARDE